MPKKEPIIKKTVFTIGQLDTPGHSRSNLLAFIGNLPPDVPIDVTIEAHKKDRSVKQNSLYWTWVTEIGKYLGNEKDEMHDYFKEKFAVIIFMRDDLEYGEAVKAVTRLRKSGGTEDAAALKRAILKLTSTTDFDTKQMAEYLGEIERFAVKSGAPITFPDDLYRDAMGK